MLSSCFLFIFFYYAAHILRGTSLILASRAIRSWDLLSFFILVLRLQFQNILQHNQQKTILEKNVKENNKLCIVFRRNFENISKHFVTGAIVYFISAFANYQETCRSDSPIKYHTTYKKSDFNY